MSQTESINIVDPEVDARNGYVSIKNLVQDLKPKRHTRRRYVKLRAPAVRRDGKRVYWMEVEVMEDENERLKDEVGCVGGPFWGYAKLVGMLKKIANGPFGALFGLPMYEI